MEFIVYNIISFQNNTDRKQFLKILSQVVITVQLLLQFWSYNKITSVCYG